jgi:aldose 1-epimerase
MTAPSGAQHELFLLGGTNPDVAVDQRVVVVEVGGGIRSFTVGDRDVVDGYAEDAMADGGRGQVLVPWPNRIEGGAYSFGGKDLQLPLTEVAKGNAIHGLLRWATWTVYEHEPFAALGVQALVHPQPGYPFVVRVQVRYEIWDGLRVTTTATNLGEVAAPYGLGFHPYLSAGGGTVDALALTCPAGTVLHSDEQGIPRSRGTVDGTDYDFRSSRPIGDLVLDHAYTDLQRDDAGLATVTLSDPAGAWSSELWMDSSFGHLMVYSGDTLAPDRRRRGLAVEPMTCPPNAFRTGEALITLEPGESTTSTWGIRSRQP